MHEVVIVGGGIAGASLAYFLARAGVSDIILVEREQQPGFHATGRSAASLVELDPNPTVQKLKMAGAPFLRAPPLDLGDRPLVEPTGILFLVRGAPLAESREPRVVALSREQVVERVPVVRPEEIDGGLLLPEDGHIDVARLLEGYLAGARRGGCRILTGAAVTAVRTERGRVAAVVTSAGELPARWIVNAAGAWAGELGEMAGAAPIEITPRRRCIATFAAPAGVDPTRWPLAVSDAHSIYFGPESGGLLLSPMDEQPMAPCDARPDEEAIAGALERLGRLAPPLLPRSLRRRWAGLRTFTRDRVPVVGEDERVRGFFWLAGQGGCGIETSPILGQIASDLIVAGRTDRFDAGLLAPSRL